MANYFEMSKDQLRAEKAALEQSYAEFKAKGLKLNMARGKPGPHQMDLAMDLLKMSDYTTEDGYDARNYGNLEGLEEARALFGDVMGVKSSEVFCGRQLQPAADVQPYQHGSYLWLPGIPLPGPRWSTASSSARPPAMTPFQNHRGVWL